LVVDLWQIRVHLQHLGHPIANDVQYGGDGRIAYAHAPVTETAAAERRAEGGATESTAGTVEAQQQQQQQQQAGGSASAVDYHVDYHGSLEASKVDDACPHCPRLAPEGWEPIEVAGLWLHAKRYRALGGEFDFEGPAPAWAEAAFAVRGVGAGDGGGRSVAWELAPIEAGAEGNDRKRMRIV